jgi:DNA excision repair protein ERCC-1
VDQTDQKSLFTSVVGTVRSVNKTDTATLASSFGSLARVATASVEELSVCPGLGHKKVRRIFDAFNKPFVTSVHRYHAPPPFI